MAFPLQKIENTSQGEISEAQARIKSQCRADMRHLDARAQIADWKGLTPGFSQVFRLSLNVGAQFYPYTPAPLVWIAAA
jgi:hypothetical protein